MSNWKEYLAKYFTNLVSVVTLLGAIYLGFDYFLDYKKAEEERLLLEERYGKLINTQEEGEKVSELTAQLITSYKEQVELAKEVKEAWKTLAVEREERIKHIQETIIQVDENTEAQQGPDYSFMTKDGSKGYSLNELRIDGKDSPPIGYVMIQNDGKVYKKNYKFQIKVESVQLKDDLTGKVRIVSRAFLVPLENGLAEKRRPDLKKWKDNPYQLDVAGGELTVDPIEPSSPEIKEKGFLYWPMNVNIGAGLFGNKGETASKFYGDVTLIGYGLSKQNLDWKLLNLGVNFNDTDGGGFHLMPFTYRPFPDIMTNTYIGPGYSLDGTGDKYFLGVSVGL